MSIGRPARAHRARSSAPSPPPAVHIHHRNVGGAASREVCGCGRAERSGLLCVWGGSWVALHGCTTTMCANSRPSAAHDPLSPRREHLCGVIELACRGFDRERRGGVSPVASAQAYLKCSPFVCHVYMCQASTPWAARNSQTLTPASTAREAASAVFPAAAEAWASCASTAST